MAIFSNQATLTYKGTATDSNIVYGELVEDITVEKVAVEEAYSQGQRVTYVVTLRNTGTEDLRHLTLTDDLGGYLFQNTVLYPLTYVPNTLRYFLNGVFQAAPLVDSVQPLRIVNLTLPAGATAVVVYQAAANEFAPPEQGGMVQNTVTVLGEGLGGPVTATETLPVAQAPALTVTKAVSPTQVAANDRITYTFLIQNTGNLPVVATDDAVITDHFDPVLRGLTVTLNGNPLLPGTGYNYSEATGRFTTAPGAITVPGATYNRDPTTGRYTVIPGAVTLTVTGTV